MKAIILSAGRGKRLLPLTASTPKCMLEVAGKPVIRRQIETLLAAGIDEVVVVTGFEAEKVETELRVFGHRVRTLYNPFHTVSDNLASCWLAREEMVGDFLILNGDTLFEESIVSTLLTSRHPITVTVDKKPIYDDDDMKVHCRGDRLLRIGKTLEYEQSDAESIGFLMFRGSGGKAFRSKIERMMRRATGLKSWYLSVIDTLARSHDVFIRSIEGQRWAEIDTPQDLADAGAIFAATKTRAIS